jgi:hypothetical protein
MGEKEETSGELLSEELREANISLILDSYNDIFSDFDPRSYSERALSDDFLVECRRAARDKETGVELILSVPRNKRNLNDEFRIKKRIKDHFHRHHVEKEREIKKIKRDGFIWILIGILINILVVSGFLNVESKLLHTIFGIFEVPSWFLIWEGLSKILLESRKFEPEYIFYRKMANAEIVFRSY